MEKKMYDSKVDFEDFKNDSLFFLFFGIGFIYLGFSYIILRNYEFIK